MFNCAILGKFLLGMQPLTLNGIGASSDLLVEELDGMVDFQVLVVVGGQIVVCLPVVTAWKDPMLDDRKEGVPISQVHTNHEDFLPVKLLPTTKHPLTIHTSTTVELTFANFSLVNLYTYARPTNWYTTTN